MDDLRWQWSSFESLSVAELYAVMALRQAVFVVEQDCAYLDADGLDDQAMHLLVWRGDALVAYLRAFPAGIAYREAAIGRVITAQSARGQGLGRPLMRYGMQCVVDTWGPQPIKLGGQSHLKDYYGSLGFVVVGDEYDEDGIPHLPMRWPGPA